MTEFDLTDMAICLNEPQVECVAPWNLARKGITLTEWASKKDNIFIGYGVPLATLVGPGILGIPRRKLKWECRYYGYDYMKRYKQYVKRLWKDLDELAECTLGCYCFNNDNNNCPCKILVRLYRAKTRGKTM